MRFTHDDLCRIEWAVGRVMRACQLFAEEETTKALSEAEQILSIVRHAGMSLTDPNDKHHHAEVTQMLIRNLYTNQPE